MDRGALYIPGGRGLIGKRTAWKPRDLCFVLVESWLDNGAQLHTVPRASGTTPPALTLGGTLTGSVWPYVQVDSIAGGTALGQATYKVSYNDGSTFPHTGILTSGTPTALPGIGSAITATFAAGPYAANNIWQPLCARVDDVSGFDNHATQATASRMPILRMVAYNGKPCLDYGVGTTFGLQTPSITLGPNTLFAILRGDATSGAIITHAGDGGNVSFWSSTNSSSIVTRSAVNSAKDVSVSWMRGGTRKTAGRTFNGTHATHLVYANAVDQNATTSGGFASDPGVAGSAGAIYIGNAAAFNASLRGLMAGWVVLGRSISATEMLRLHNYAIRRFPL